MIQSNCGILCSKCEYKETLSCKTCLYIDNPFWDQCPIKDCTKEKEIVHCGKCKDFPCKLLKNFSYDKEQGDDGLRIKPCEKWEKSDI